MVPYVVLGLLVAAAGGALYSSGAIGILTAYALGFAAIVVSGTGYVRWDERHNGPGARHH